MRFVILAAAAALSFAAPAQAADYIEYVFTAQITGRADYFNGSTPISGLHSFTYIVGLNQTLPSYYTETADSAWSTGLSGSTFPAAVSTPNATATADTITFSSSAPRSNFFRVTCTGDVGGRFSAATQLSCGSISYSANNGRDYFTTFGGPVSFVRATEHDGVAPYVGFAAPNFGVPEPATWALMLTGFGFVGGAMRRRTYASNPAKCPINR